MQYGWYGRGTILEGIVPGIRGEILKGKREGNGASMREGERNTLRLDSCGCNDGQPRVQSRSLAYIKIFETASRSTLSRVHNLPRVDGRTLIDVHRLHNTNGWSCWRLRGSDELKKKKKTAFEKLNKRDIYANIIHSAFVVYYSFIIAYL